MTSKTEADRPWLNREGAAAWCRQRGLLHVTTVHLRDLADAGKGPPYSRMSKYTYYAVADLEEWLATAMVPATRSRGKVTPPPAPGRSAAAAG